LEGRRWRRRSVAEGLENNSWITDIRGPLTILILILYVQLHEQVELITLDPAVSDSTVWRWNRQVSTQHLWHIKLSSWANMRWKERKNCGRFMHQASVGCSFGSCCKTAFGLRSAYRDMVWTITAPAPCVRNVLSPTTIASWRAHSVVSYGSNASVAAVGITSRRQQVTSLQDGGSGQGREFPRQEGEP
jgi:hypothetical protein